MVVVNPATPLNPKKASWKKAFPELLAYRAWPSGISDPIAPPTAEEKKKPVIHAKRMDIAETQMPMQTARMRRVAVFIARDLHSRS